MTLPEDYAERVYAGVLGKIIGVYLGRPFEGWPHSLILERLGEIQYYVHDRLDLPLIVTDDDISGTFTFLRALPDHGHDPDISPAAIGRTWLNYLVEGRTVLWWGGLGNSTEHTAYLRLKDGVEAPRSGSMELNGQVVSEQIGAQIFIDGWAMVCPGDPERAADLARRAASVSHDGEAIYGAQVVAAMESLAFVESDMGRLLDAGVAQIPADCVIRRVVDDVRDWHAGDPDWHHTRDRLEERYGYDRYGGNCHMVPNHGLIILSLLHGDGDFSRSLSIVNTCGWDTDCNSANVGCLMGIRNGLEGIDSGPDWRGPVSDRLYLPTIDGGRSITDAASEAMRIVDIGHALADQPRDAPKGGARFHFDLPGSVQGFRPEGVNDADARVENVSRAGRRCLAIRYRDASDDRPARAATGVFIESHDTARSMEAIGYGLMASPSLYPGQHVLATLSADEANGSEVRIGLYATVYNAQNELDRLRGPAARLRPGGLVDLEWQIPDTAGYPLAEVGVEVRGAPGREGAVYLDRLDWSGAPDVTLTRTLGGTMWRRAWANGVESWDPRFFEPYRLIQNRGIGIIVQGTREWKDYAVTADITPHLAESAGVCARVQGMRRYYALLLCRDGRLRLVKASDGNHSLGEEDVGFRFGDTRLLSLTVEGSRLRAFMDHRPVFDLRDDDRPLTEGAIGLLCEEGRTATQTVRVRPLSHARDPAA